MVVRDIEALHDSSFSFNPSNAAATFVQITRMQRFYENNLNSVKLEGSC